MKPFQDKNLRDVLENTKQKITQHINALSNSIILANDLEILESNFVEEFRLAPIVVEQEDYLRIEINQRKVKIQSAFSRARYYDEEDIDKEVDGIELVHYFPYSGEKWLFSCRASTFSLSGYPEIIVNDRCFVIKQEFTLSETREEHFKDKADKKLTESVSSILAGVEYANKDVEEFNAQLSQTVHNTLAKKREDVEQYVSITKAYSIPLTKSEYVDIVMPQKSRIAPISTKFVNEQTYCIKEEDYETIKDY